LGSEFVMIYTGLSEDGAWRLCLATSSDGVSWERQGVILDLGGPDEDRHLANANLLQRADGDWNVYYNARGAVFQVFLATLENDETGPSFEGAREVTDLGKGNVRISWDAATDPSLPIEYDIFVDTDPANLGSGDPLAVSENTSVVVGGLSPSLTYHVWVRASDGRGNPDTNDAVLEVTLKPPSPDLSLFWPVIPLLAGGVVSVSVVALLRRKASEDAEKDRT
jgi:hypothetical protein